MKSPKENVGTERHKDEKLGRKEEKIKDSVQGRKAIIGKETRENGRKEVSKKNNDHKNTRTFPRTTNFQMKRLQKMSHTVNEPHPPPKPLTVQLENTGDEKRVLCYSGEKKQRKRNRLHVTY